MGKNKNNIFHKYSLYYWLSAIIRILLVFLPQFGYIHPDEFFQSVEILAGKILEVENSPPWEFNSTFPIRSMTIPYFTVGMSYKFLKEINYFAKGYLQTNILNSYILLVLPRFTMCMFSFIVDYCLYKICANNNEKYKAKLLVLSLSYVMIVYATRTFSNAIELILFAILLYFVCESLTFSNIMLRKKEYLNYRYTNSKTIVDRAKFHKLRLFIKNDSLRNCFFISTVTVMGFFNRPTFLAFALFPVFFWLYRGIGYKSVTSLQFHKRIIVFAICSIPSFLFIILIDSFFYGYITWGEIGMLDVSINSFVFTPLNFLKYNIDSNNLAIHGLHPRFLHILVNIPLLYNVLGICTFASLLKYCYRCYQCKFHLLPTVRSIKGLMILSYIAPVAFLSIFPHQEPRFLIPIILPLAYLHGNTILDDPENIITEAPKFPVKNTRPPKSYTNVLFKIWGITNMIMMVFYGMIHQGGVIQATNYLSNDLVYSKRFTEYHIVTSHIYSLPESFLLQTRNDKIYKMGDKKFTYKKRVFLYEEGSKNLSYIADKVESIVNHNEFIKRNDPKKSFKVLLLISSSLDIEFESIIKSKKLSYKTVSIFYPHLSMEAFPDLTMYCLEIMQYVYKRDCIALKVSDYFKRIISLFGLKLYQVSSLVEGA